MTDQSKREFLKKTAGATILAGTLFALSPLPEKLSIKNYLSNKKIKSLSSDSSDKSRILIIFHSTFFSYKLPAYYDQLTKELIKNFDVLIINSFGSMGKICDFSHLTLEKIKNFKPDLIISYNNVMNKEIYQSTNCPVFLIEADSYPHLFNDISLMKKNVERIWFGAITNYRISRAQSMIDYLNKNRFILFKNSTSMSPDYSKKPEINISFIGTIMLNIFNNNGVTKFIHKNLSNPNKLKEIKKIIDQATLNIDSLTKDDFEKFEFTYNDIFRYVSFMNRINTLDQISTLGLKSYCKIQGDLNLLNSFQDFPFSVVQNDDILNAKDNENIFNNSKLSINIMYAHAVGGYPWRIPDIMATSSCLVSSKTSAIDDDFKKWLDIPQFSNKREAYDLCKKLLENDNLRKEISLKSNLAIKEGKFTFKDRVDELTEIFNLKIAKNNDNYFEYINFQKMN
jgi:hypothetical protein